MKLVFGMIGMPAKIGGESLPLGAFAVTTAQGEGESSIPPGAIFCLRAAGEAAIKAIEPGYPLAPHYIVHVGDDGAVLLPHAQAKQALDRVKQLAHERDMIDTGACAHFDKTTRDGQEMATIQKLLARAVASITGKNEERAVASLFSPGGTHAKKGEFAGIDDFEVVAYLIVLPSGLELPFGERYKRFLGALDKLPEDLASQHEHYRLGTKKR